MTIVGNSASLKAKANAPFGSTPGFGERSTAQVVFLLFGTSAPHEINRVFVQLLAGRVGSVAVINSEISLYTHAKL